MKWSDFEDIAQILEEKYPSENILALRFTKLHQMIVGLDEFSDMPDKSNEKILEAILMNWLEIREDK